MGKLYSSHRKAINRYKLENSELEKRIPTSELLRRMFKTRNIKSFIKRYNKEMERVPLCVYLNRLCNDKNEVPEHIILKSGIDRIYGHQIFNGTRKPSRDKLIQLAFGFGISYDETQDLLRIAGKSQLYPRVERDAVFIYALGKTLSIDDVQATLEELGMPLLGKEEKLK